MDGGHHWTDRGAGNEPPAGTNVIKLSASQGVLLEGSAGDVVRFVREKDEKEWKFSAVKVAAEFKGYDLDKAGNPTFRSAGEGFALTDAWLPEEQSGKAALSRTLKVTGDKAVTIVLARDLAVSGPSDGVAEIAGGLVVRAVSGPAPKANANDKTLTLTLIQILEPAFSRIQSVKSHCLIQLAEPPTNSPNRCLSDMSPLTPSHF